MGTLDFESNRIFKFFVNQLPVHLLSDLDERNASSVLLMVILSNILICFLMVPIFLVLFNSSPVVYHVGMPIIGGCLFLYAIAYLKLIYHGQRVFAGNVAMMVFYIMPCLAVWLADGIESSMLFLLFLPPVFSFLLTNALSGAIWFALTIAAFVGFWMAQYIFGYEPLHIVQDPAQQALLTIIIPITVCIIMMIAILTYEATGYQLRQQLTKERNLMAFKAMHDPLTGLANRAEFSLRLQMAINDAKHSGTPFALLYLDLDGFKPINDSLGHHAGDEVLQKVAQRLKGAVRGTDLTARLGGDEFAIILQGMRTQTMVEPVLQKILETVSTMIDLGDLGTVSVQASIGAVFYKEKLDDPEEICRYADEAMYKAKEKKNTWFFANNNAQT